MAIAVKKTWDDQRLKRDRLTQVQEQMKRRGIGALYLSDGINLRYILNLKIPGAEVFVPPEGEALAFIRPRDVGYVELHHKNIQAPLYNRSAARDGSHPEEAERFAEGILDLMKRHHVAGEFLGADHLGIPIVLELIKAGIRLTDARPVIERSGSVKTRDEVEIYRCLGAQYTHAIRAFRDALRPGVSENELAGIVVSAWYEAGGEDIAQLNVCAGENMNPWRRWPTQRPVKEGEFVGVDLHGRGLNGLRGDGSRTFFAGDRPTVEQRDLYRRAYDYLQETIDIFRAGRSFAAVIEAAPKVEDKYQARLYNLNIGHGAGLGSSGYPHIEKRKKPPDDVLKPNQVIAVECYFAEEGSSLAVKLEEMVLVTDGKPEPLAPDMPYDNRFLA
jgi:Xaa-Pro aminopeptidase